ncbi:hypothetical protein KEM52_002998, partial [Ascosphaera acerosa]
KGFKTGDWVLVRQEDPQKLEPKWFELYRVLKAHPLGTYALQEPEEKVMTNLVNGARLVKAYVANDDVKTWSSSRWCKALKRHGLKVHNPLELRHVLDDVEKDIVTYSEMSTITKAEWDAKYGPQPSQGAKAASKTQHAPRKAAQPPIHPRPHFEIVIPARKRV